MGKKEQDEIREFFKEQLKNFLHRKIQLKQNETDHELESYELSDIIKGTRQGIEAFQKFLEFKYKDALRYKKENIFPKKWMQKNKRISDQMDRNPTFLPLVNYIYNRSRSYRGNILKEMIAEQQRIMTAEDKAKWGDKYRGKNGEYIYSTFLTTKPFYKEVAKALRISVSTVQLYIKAFEAIGIIKLLHDGRNRGRLYADGYFTETPDNSYRKHSFLIETSSIKEGLYTLSFFTSSYRK